MVDAYFASWYNRFCKSSFDGKYYTVKEFQDVSILSVRA